MTVSRATLNRLQERIDAARKAARWPAVVVLEVDGDETPGAYAARIADARQRYGADSLFVIVDRDEEEEAAR